MKLHGVKQLTGNYTGLGNRYKVQIVEKGKVVFTSDWKSNLILDQGLDNMSSNLICNLFLYAVVGTGSTPTQDDSGSILATASGTSVTSDTAIFASGDVGKLLRFDTGEKAKITAFTDNQHVTIDTSLTVSTGTHFVLYRVAQTALDNEIHRTNTYLTGASNCFSNLAANVYTHQRTFDFPIETSDQTYNEIGFSNSASAGANLNMRSILPGAPVTVVTGQQLRVVYQVMVTLNPATPTSKTASISGWPSLQHSVVASASTDLITLVGHGFPDGMKFFLNGTTAPGGLTLGTQYYVKSNNADTFYVAASPGGAAIDLTSDGSGLILFTNTDGSEQLFSAAVSTIDSNGNTVSNGRGSYNTNEPGSGTNGKVVVMLTDSGALPTFNSGSVLGTGVVASKTSSADTYTNGSFTRTFRVTFSASEANSSAIRKIICGSYTGAVAGDGPCFLFDQPQEKTNLYTLTLVYRWTWDRLFS